MSARITDFEKSKYNRVIQAFRQPGSSFKPIIYAAALENGFTPNSIIIDSPEALGITDKAEAAAIVPLIHTKRGIGYVLRGDQ